MPSFTPGVNPIADVAAQQYKKELKEAKVDAKMIATACIDQPTGNAAKTAFLATLSKYLNTRSTEVFGNDAKEIRKRANFIENLRTAPTPEVEKSLLQETNIRGFKGFFSQRLYDHLVERRESKELKPIRLD